MTENTQTQLNFKPTVIEVRIYIEGGSFEEKDPYQGVCVLNITGDTAYISLMLGDGMMNKTVYVEIVRYLENIGVRKMKYERRGKMKSRRISDIKLPE